VANSISITVIRTQFFLTVLSYETLVTNTIPVDTFSSLVTIVDAILIFASRALEPWETLALGILADSSIVTLGWARGFRTVSSIVSFSAITQSISAFTILGTISGAGLNRTVCSNKVVIAFAFVV